MAKKTSGTELVVIIASMNRSEKRYFRMSAQQWGHSDGAVLKLYDYLLSVQAWEDKAIRKEFEGEAFLKQLNVTRARLQERLLEALRNYDNAGTYQLEFSKRLDEIDVLYRRKLTNPCIRLAQNALRRVQALELPQQELAVLHWMLRLERQKSAAYVTKRTAELHRLLGVATDRVVEETHLLKIHDEMLGLLPVQTKNPTERLAAADALLADSKLPNSSVELRFDARILYHYVFIYHAYIHADFDNYLFHYHQLIAIWEGNPLRMRMEQERNFKTYIGFIEAAMMASQYAEIPKTIAKLRRILAYSNVLRPMEKTRILSIELAYRCKTGRFAECLPILPEVISTIAQYQSQVPQMVLLNLLSNSLIAAFILEHWGMLAGFEERLEAAIAQYAQHQLTDLLLVCRWVRFYELKLHDELEKSIKQFIRKTETSALKEIQTYFFKLMDCFSEKEEMLQFKELNRIVSVAMTQKASAQLDLLRTWTDSKLSATPMLALAKGLE